MQRSLLLFEEGIKSPHTKKVYRGHLDAFLKFAKIPDPDKLLQLSRDQLQILLEDYVFHIKKRINPNSVPTSLQGVKHFFAMSDVMINWKKLAKFYPEKIKNLRIKICVDCGSSCTLINKDKMYCKSCHCLIYFRRIFSCFISFFDCFMLGVFFRKSYFSDVFPLKLSLIFSRRSVTCSNSLII